MQRKLFCMTNPTSQNVTGSPVVKIKQTHFSKWSKLSTRHMPTACHNSYTLKNLMELLKYFSKSLIIHEEKTKEITTVKEVWISGPNYIIKFGEVLFWFSPKIINALRSDIKHLKECFIRYPNTSKLFKKTQLHLVFSTHFLVFEYLIKHSSSCLIYIHPRAGEVW